jgi:hypothetical protein
LFCFSLNFNKFNANQPVDFAKWCSYVWKNLVVACISYKDQEENESIKNIENGREIYTEGENDFQPKNFWGDFEPKIWSF